MPEAKKNISADTKRSILQHLMFGMLGLLILMNWTVHRPIDYGVFIQTFETAAISEDEYSSSLFNGMVETYENEGGDKLQNKVELAKYIKGQTDSIILDLDNLIEILNGKKIISDLKMFDRIVALRDSLHFSYRLDSDFPFSDTAVFRLKNLFLLGTNQLSYLPKNYFKVLLFSLRQDVLKARSIYNELIFSSMHDGTLWCQFYSAFFYSADAPFFVGDKVIAESSVRDVSFRFNSKYDTVKVNAGRLETSNLNHGYAIWYDRSRYLGKNIVSGFITRMHNKDTITRPFSFSYFVSAPGIAMHLDKANICYVAVPNPISISVPGYSADKINLKVAGAKVSKTENGRFEIFFSKIPSAKVYAYVEATNEQGRTSTVHSMEIKVRDLPSPTTNLASFKESGISLEEFKNLKSIKVQPVDAAFDLEYEVVSFQVEGISHDGKYIEPITVYGDELSGNHELNSVFKTTVSGDRFIFSHIRAKATNGKDYEALPVSLLLK